VIKAPFDGLKSKLHDVLLLLNEGQRLYDKGRGLDHLCGATRKAFASRHVRDKGYGYDANQLRQALAAQGIMACIPSRSNRQSRSNMIAFSIATFSVANGTRSKMRSAGSRACPSEGGLAAHPHPLRWATYIHVCPSAPQQPSSFSSDQGVLSRSAFQLVNFATPPDESINTIRNSDHGKSCPH
jgi:hypothetical protein